VADHLQPAARKAGIPRPVGFHTLRRTLASALVAKGNDIRLVQELLRHSDPLLTHWTTHAAGQATYKLRVQ